uniref:BHLH domain-containing protein n=1 Tax=Oncorhynchus tshawytscha TaxID=74940 RepID=A0A8C8D0W0_ONCTS
MSVACKTINVSPACKTIHVSPALGQYNPDSVEVIMSQNGCVPNDQSQILGTELNLMEMTEVEYTHLQHIIQSHMEAQAAGPEGSGDARFNTTVFTVENSAPQPTNCEAEYPAKSPPNTPPDAMSTSTDEQQYILGGLNQGGQVDIKEIKMVLVSDGNVIPGERTPTTCGEVPGSVLAKIRSAVDATQERGLEAYNNGSTQLLSRPNPPARVRLEKRFNCTPCDIPRQQDVQSAALSKYVLSLHFAATGATGGAGAKKRGGPPVESSQRRERHNSKERDRRRRIRFCCDELNVLAPFCNHETDKATTLQWTTAFLKYVREVYGDSIKQEFQGTFCGKTGQRLKPSSASGQVMVRQETAEPSSTLQASEQ